MIVELNTHLNAELAGVLSLYLGIDTLTCLKLSKDFDLVKLMSTVALK